MSVQERLDEVLGIMPPIAAELLPAETTGTEIVPVSVEDEEAKQQRAEDRKLVKDTLRDMLTKSSEAFENLIFIAKESEMPRSYEVIGNLMRSISDVASKLNELSEEPEEKKKTEVGDTKITNQNLFVGSSEELLQIIREQRSLKSK